MKNQVISSSCIFTMSTIIVILDQLSKKYIANSIEPRDPTTFINLFRFTIVRNLSLIHI